MSPLVSRTLRNIISIFNNFVNSSIDASSDHHFPRVYFFQAIVNRFKSTNISMNFMFTDFSALFPDISICLSFHFLLFLLYGLLNRQNPANKKFFSSCSKFQRIIYFLFSQTDSILRRNQLLA